MGECIRCGLKCAETLRLPDGIRCQECAKNRIADLEAKLAGNLDFYSYIMGIAADELVLLREVERAARVMLMNDGGEGARCYDATKFLESRDSLTARFSDLDRHREGMGDK